MAGIARLSARRAPDWAWVGLAAFAAALALRLTGIGSRDVWLDEAYSQFAISRDWAGLVADRVREGHSPLYFGLMKALGVDPGNLLALRRISAGFDAAAAGVLGAGVTRYVGLRAGILAAALYVVSPAHVHWAQNARPYGLLMLFTATGLVGAMGLADGIGRARPDRAPRLPHLLFALGWSGAALTLTGGIVACLAVVLLPWLPGMRRGPMGDPAFRRRWRRAAVAPVLAALAVFALVSRAHVAERIGDYWLEDDRPFGAASLVWLAEELAAGRARHLTLPYRALDGAWETGAALAAMALLLALAALGAWRSRDRPAVLPAIGLGVGVSLLLLLASLSTSLLIDRYFTPGWMGLLALAGIGLATLRGPAMAILLCPLLVIGAQAGHVAATAPYGPRAEAPQRLARIIETSPHRQAPVLVTPALATRIQMEIMLLRLDAPALPRPDIVPLRDVPTLAADRSRDRPVFLVTGAEDWRARHAAALPDGTCRHRDGGWVLAFTGAPCPDPLRPGGR